MKNTLALFLIFALGALPGCRSQDAEQPPEESIAVTLWTDQFELFMEYPVLRVGNAARFAAHLTHLATFQPVTSGPVRFEFYREGRIVESVVVREAVRPGIFIPEVIFDTAGELTLRLAIEDQSTASVIEVSPLYVYGPEAEVPAAPEVNILGDRITYLKEQQWRLPFWTEPARVHHLRSSLTVSGRVEADPGRDFSVVPPLAGRLLPPPDGLPTLGQRLQKGELLGWIDPPVAAPQQASLENARVQTGISRAELEQKMAEARAALVRQQSEVEIASQEKDRTRKLFQIEAVPQRRLFIAEKQLEVAEANLKAAEENLATLVTTKERLDERAAGQGPLQHRMPLYCPGTGTIVQMTATPGAFVEPDRTLFRVVDPSTVWMRAHLHESQVSGIRKATGAAIRLSGGSEMEAGPKNARLLLIGEVVDPETRTLPMVWEIQNTARQLKIGMLAEVDIFTGEELETRAVPSSAVFEEENKKVVYVQAAGETFDRRIVQTGIEDKGFIQILEGLSAGERVVVEGGYEVGLAARSTESAGEGHVH